MKKVMVKVQTMLLAIILLGSFVGYQRYHESTQAGETSDGETQVVKSGNEYCRINGKNFYFVPDENKQKWIEPLAKLLANERREIYDRFASGDRYIIPDPDAPYIEL